MTATAPDPAQEQLAELAALAAGTEGGRIARRALQAVGLPPDPVRADDLLLDAWLRISGRIGRHGPLEPRADGGSPVAAYLTRTVRNLAHDELTVWRREAPDPFDDSRPDAWPRVVHHDTAGLDHRLDAARWRLQAALRADDAWVGAAALAHVTLAEDPARPVHPAVPRPAVDREGTHERWAALFYAGRDDCLPGPDGADPAPQRNRRARAGAKIEAALRAAMQEEP